MLDILFLLAAGTSQLEEVDHAILAGRLDQARTMLAAAIARGEKGTPIDRRLADLAFARGASAEALARYKALLAASPGQPLFAERAAISAVKTGDLLQAEQLAARASAVPEPSWRAWNLRGVLADLRGNFAVADLAYQEALTLAPEQGEVLNNIGWSHLLRGDWDGAVGPLERAAAIMGTSKRAMNNLELARAATDSSLPARRAGESDRDYAARLNDAGVAAQLRGEKARAIAAFTRAMEARGSWFERASRNLQKVSSAQ